MATIWWGGSSPTIPFPGMSRQWCLFDGRCAPFYGNFLTLENGAVMRAALSPRAQFLKSHGVVGSLTTVENEVKLDPFAIAAVETTAEALGVDASRARAFSLGCGMELLPDPERRLTLSGERDALGMPRLNLAMTITDDDFARFRLTLAELGRQLLAAKTGMIHLNYNSRDEWLKAMDWGNHHLGTTRMHDDPKQGVVDADSKVHGVGNLYVAGSSVFPTYGSSNPTLNLGGPHLAAGRSSEKGDGMRRRGFARSGRRGGGHGGGGRRRGVAIPSVRAALSAHAL